MKTLVAVLLGTVLLSGCVPVEVKRNQAGALAYRIKNGVAVAARGAKAPRKFTALLGKGEKCQPAWLEWSPDGRRIYFCAPRVTLPAPPVDMDKVPFGLFVFDLERRTTTLLSRPDERVLYSAASPSGRGMLYVAARGDKALEGAVILLDERIGERTTVAENRGNLFPFWADEDRIAFASGGVPERVLARDRRGENEQDLTTLIDGIDID